MIVLLCRASVRSLLVGVALLAMTVSGVYAARVTVVCDGDRPQAEFARAEIASAVRAMVEQAALSDSSGAAKGYRVVLATTADRQVVTDMKAAGVAPSGDLEPEGFSIRLTDSQDERTIWVIGADAAGMMYGGLELAEVVCCDGPDAVAALDQNPYMAMRGTKFNIPLDVRTPTYTEPCDAAQKNMPEMWNMDFWTDYIDHLTRYRYNFVSLWSLHPFPSMVKVPGYEAIALSDVRRSTIAWEEYYSGTGTGFDAPEIVNDYETLKEMTIDEKIDFWREVMAYAKGRNVVFYVVTWNVFVNGTDGKYGITDRIENDTTRDYFRKSVKQLLLTYPDLAGVGLTTGENMHKASFADKEDWAFDTYARGVLDVAAEQPERRFTLIHRQHQTGAKDIARRFQPLIDKDNVDFLFSFKYAKAHVFSSTTQPYHPGFVEDIQGMKTIWTLRNDDAYYFRWGAPDFVREFIQNIPYEVSQGYYYGSDQWVWGCELLSREPEAPRQIELAKHWYHWMLWGRMGYDPTLTNERFAKILDRRYPSVSGEDLLVAWQEASMIYPVTTGFHWGALDFQWYIESCKSRPGPAQTETGFHDVNRFITLGTHGGTDNISIPDYVKAVAEGKEVEGTTPLAVSAKLLGHAARALDLIDGMSHGGNKELRHTLDDIRAIALLGQYYGHKVRGATELAVWRASKEEAHQLEAIAALNRAATSWRRYASVALGQYENPLWTNRVGHCDWRKLYRHVLDDVRTAGGEPRPQSIDFAPGGTVLSGTSQGSQIAWTFDAPAPGTYLVELRYALPGLGELECDLAVNDRPAVPFIAWTTGGPTIWACDRVPVELTKGENRIRLGAEALPQIDALNVLATDQ